MLTFGFLNLKAQSIEKHVVGSMGNTTSSGDIILNATLGELSVATKTGTFILTEGYHQGNENISIGIEEMDLNIDFSLYPNPSSDFIFLELKAKENISAQINIVNTIGKKVSNTKEITEMETKTSFDISNLASGIFYLNIIFENQETKKNSFQKY